MHSQDFDLMNVSLAEWSAFECSANDTSGAHFKSWYIPIHQFSKIGSYKILIGMKCIIDTQSILAMLAQHNKFREAHHENHPQV